MKINRKTSWLGLFLKMFANHKYKQNSDLFILVGGNVGMGKSATAMLIASELDNSFEKNMEKRILFNTHQLELFGDFIQYRKEKIEEWIDNPHTTKPPMECFVIDEGQNVLYRRNATTKSSKKLVADIKTMRYLNSIVIVCIPDPNMLDSDIINRFDMLIIPEKEGENRIANIWINQIGNYIGRLQMAMGAFERMKSEKKILSFDVSYLLSQGVPPADIEGRIKYNPTIYEKYEKLKIRGSFQTDEKKSDEQEDKLKIEFEQGGDYKIEEVPAGALKLNNFYSYKVLSKATGRSIIALKKKVYNSETPPRSMKKGRRKYFLLEDIVNILK